MLVERGGLWHVHTGRFKRRSAVPEFGDGGVSVPAMQHQGGEAVRHRQD